MFTQFYYQKKKFLKSWTRIETLFTDTIAIKFNSKIILERQKNIEVKLIFDIVQLLEIS